MMVGADVTRCPTAAGLKDPETLAWGQIVPGPTDLAGAFAGIPARELPPRTRSVLRYAEGLLAEWTRKAAERGGHRDIQS